MSPLYFLIFCAPLAAVAQPRASTDKCPAIAPLCPAANDQCPALEPLPAHECPPKEASMADCVGYDCRYGCQPFDPVPPFQASRRWRRSSSPAKSRREAPPSPQISNPVVEKAPSRKPEPDEQLEFQGGELR